MKIIKEFPHQVQIIEDWIPLSDGTRLWMKAWRPITDDPVPAILEYLPYRAGDWTAPRDHERHPYYAGHGYASIRVDIRGHGNSEGIPGDEYSPQEHADGIEVINWIAKQPWCTGKIGMFGISWGGFNSLQLAALQPEPLKAIVTTCSTDDRYDNDVHYFGGSMLAVDMHAFESRPLDKRVWGEQWREKWLHRLQNMEPYIDTWLSHQTRDKYWQHGSVCEDYSRLNAAGMAVGGWNDPYRDTVLRLVENLSKQGKNVRGLIGPWSHQYPDRDLKPGPHIDFLGETLRWWDHWLKDEDNDAMDTPLLRTWITDSVPPASVYDEMPGRWVAETQWPSPQIQNQTHTLADGHLTPIAAKQKHTIEINSPQNTGTCAGRYFPFGNDADLPTDQRPDDGRSVTFDYPISEDTNILGNAAIQLRVKANHPKAQIYVRLCDVAPNGASTLITRGNLNLTSREGRHQVKPMPTNQWEDVTIPITGTGYRIPAGHALRVAISTAYWPWIWPQPQPTTIQIDPQHSALHLPVRNQNPQIKEQDQQVRFDPAQQPEPLPVQYPETGRAGAQRPERLISEDVVARETYLQVDPAYGGTRIYPDGLHFNEDSVERYWIQWDNPLKARTESEWKISLTRPDLNWKASLEATTRIQCDENNFYTESIVTCWEDEEQIFHRSWKQTIPREAS
ncbi:MAG: CocE/NonD family hydrolase [Actinomycetaceae bacterium]|nr:CocE/NonD family hydrolase [Actinomycetaceae bacterium]